MSKHENLKNKKFGRLTAINRVENTAKGNARWLCKCDCGGMKIVVSSELKRGGTKSCGCLAQEQREKAAKSRCHAHSRANLCRERKSWENMLARCYDSSCKSFSNYGGAGITVCETWRHSFKSFFADLGPRPIGHTLDRIDSSKGYFKENCRWATNKEQANNRSNNRRLAHNGKTMTISQWADELGLTHTCISMRLKRGWPVHRALSVYR